MNAFRKRKWQIAGCAGVGLAAYGLSDHIDAIAFAPGGTTIASEIDNVRSQLPTDLKDGSVLKNVSFDGHRITLLLDVDQRLDLRTIRDGNRAGKCSSWQNALRSREVREVEYRYQRGSETASLFLRRNDC